MDKARDKGKDPLDIQEREAQLSNRQVSLSSGQLPPPRQTPPPGASLAPGYLPSSSQLPPPATGLPETPPTGVVGPKSRPGVRAISSRPPQQQQLAPSSSLATFSQNSPSDPPHSPRKPPQPSPSDRMSPWSRRLGRAGPSQQQQQNPERSHSSPSQPTAGASSSCEPQPQQQPQFRCLLSLSPRSPSQGLSPSGLPKKVLDVYSTNPLRRLRHSSKLDLHPVKIPPSKSPTSPIPP